MGSSTTATTFFGQKLRRRSQHQCPPTDGGRSNVNISIGNSRNHIHPTKGGDGTPTTTKSFLGQRRIPSFKSRSSGFASAGGSTRSSASDISFSFDANTLTNANNISISTSGSSSTNHSNKNTNINAKKTMDVDIIKGAEILRRELSGLENHHQHHHHHDDRHYTQQQHQHQQQYHGQDPGDDADDWSPWRRAQTSKASNIAKTTPTTTAMRPLGAQSNDDIDGDDDDDEDGQGQYLPTQWLSGLSKPPSSAFSPPASNTRRSPSSSPRMNIKHSYGHDHNSDEAETSTLDFLASLHVHDNENGDMNIVGYYDDTYDEESSASTDGALQRVTFASEPFSRMISPSSYIYGELFKDEGFRHAVSAGNLWQSLCSQHMRFPALWWDGTPEPTRGPTMGTTEKFEWTYLGRHRVQGDRKLNSLIGNRGSSGRLLLHLIVRDAVTGETIEDIASGCFHPNARGVRTTDKANPQLESCRDIWIAHRRHRRSSGTCSREHDGSQNESTIESLLKYQLREQNKKRRANGGTAMSMDTPLGNPNQKIHNGNLKNVFGSKPPLFTVFVDESELFELFQSCLDGSTPASVVLLRRYLRYRIG